MRTIDMDFKVKDLPTNNGSICNCCGSSYYELSSERIKRIAETSEAFGIHNGCGYGIGVYLTDKIKQLDNDLVRIDVVQTKNGPITFAIRKKI